MTFQPEKAVKAGMRSQQPFETAGASASFRNETIQQEVVPKLAIDRMLFEVEAVVLLD